jgi:hypothetical protein
MNIEEMKIIFGHAAQIMSPTSPLTQILKLKQNLLDIILKEFDESTQHFQEEHTRLLLTFFPRIGESQIGLERFSSFLCATLSKYCQSFMKDMSKGLSWLI